MKRSERCLSSGYTWMTRPLERMRLRVEPREIVIRGGQPGARTSIKVTRDVEIANCPTCGKELRVRRHMFNVGYRMLPQHKRARPD